MSNLVVVPVAGLGVLALTPDDLRSALARGRELLGVPCATLAQAPSAVELLSAEQLAEKSGVPASWWMAQARERRVPFKKIGRRVRFEAAEALGCEAFSRKAIPAGAAGHENR